MQDKIIVIDQTIREGMQHRGIVFSYDQKKKIVGFQEKLNLDLCQAGYAPAHESEALHLEQLSMLCKSLDYKISLAGMGRAVPEDAKLLVDTGINHFHLHFHMNEGLQEKNIINSISDSIDYIRANTDYSVILVSMLDIGKMPDQLIEKILGFLAFDIGTDIVSLADTSGIMAPEQFFDKISHARAALEKSPTDLSVHCHNDMGLANANTIMGVSAGAAIIETSVLGIGERNGIADLFSTVYMLRQQGFDLNVNTGDIETFKEYYGFIDSVYKDQTGQSLISYNTPVFGRGVISHVAGTHAISSFGTRQEEDFFLNLLCGRCLVEKYLLKKNIAFDKEKLREITRQIKVTSFRLNRRVHKDEIIKIIENL